MADMRDEMWRELMDCLEVSYDALYLVTEINGYTEDTMRDILYAVAGEYEFEFEKEEEEE